LKAPSWLVCIEHTLTTTVPEGTFPKYDEVMPKRCETEITLAKEELTDAVKRVSLLASERTPLWSLLTGMVMNDESSSVPKKAATRMAAAAL